MHPKTVPVQSVDEFSPVLITNNKVDVVLSVSSKTKAGQNEH